MAEYGNDKGLINTFRQLLPADLNEKMFINAKLYPVAHAKFYAEDFDKSMLSLRMQHVHMFLIHYPAAPNSHAKNVFNMELQTQSWVAVSTCKDPTKINAIGVYNFSIVHHIQLTEVVAVGPMVHEMRWYSNYNYSYSKHLKTNMDLVAHPFVEAVARRYDLSAAQVMMLWSLQRGETIIPRLTASQFVMENMKLNVRLSQTELSCLDILVMRSNNEPSLY